MSQNNCSEVFEIHSKREMLWLFIVNSKLRVWNLFKSTSYFLQKQLWRDQRDTKSSVHIMHDSTTHHPLPLLFAGSQLPGDSPPPVSAGRCLACLACTPGWGGSQSGCQCLLPFLQSDLKTVCHFLCMFDWSLEHLNKAFFAHLLLVP